MPDVSIALSAKDKVSSILKKVSQVSGQTADEIDKLQDSLDTLSGAKIDLKTNLDKVRQQVSEARKEFRKLGDSVSEQNYKDKLSELEQLEQQYYAVSKSIRMVENEETSLAGTRSKLSNREAAGSSGSMFGSLGSALATAGFGNMLSGSLSGAAGAFFSSYYGSTEGAAVESFLGSAISGASMGASAGMMVGGPAAAGIGAAVGGLVGAVSGGIEAATQQFESRDEAFKSYVQDQYNAVQERQAADLESGSALAGQRETDLVSFTTLFGSKDTAQQYLSELKTMANVTPFLYSDLTAMSKTLKTYGYAANEMIPALTSIGDAGAALGMTAADMTNVSTALGRMRSSNKTTLEDLNILQDRGIDAIGALANAKGVSKGDAYSMISGGDIAGTEAVQIIQSYMEQMYSGAMEQQSKTFEGLSSTLEGWNQELQNAMGEGYNEGKKIGMSDQIDWLEGEAGQKMQEVYNEMGTLQSDLENMQQEMYRDIVNGMFSGDIAAGMDEQIAAQVEQMHTRYAEAMATLDSGTSSDEEKIAARAELGALMGEAQAMAESEYYNSEAVSILTDANITMASNIQSSAGSAYQNAGYSLGQQLTKGISSVLSSYVPPSIRVPVVTSSISTSAGTTTGTTTGSHLTGATSPYRAIGENRVPRDNTLYLLHEGERVLTAREARAQDQGGVGGVNIYMGGNYTVRQDSDISAIAEAVAAYILRARRIVRT